MAQMGLDPKGWGKGRALSREAQQKQCSINKRGHILKGNDSDCCGRSGLSAIKSCHGTHTVTFINSQYPKDGRRP